MQYLLSVIDETSDSATEDEMTAIRGFNDRLRSAGYWVFAGGLADPQSATVVDNRRPDGPLLTDGPFLESKEYLGGFWVIDVPDLDVALEVGADGSRSCARVVEVRPFLVG
ncbi:YciI family protein [Nocardioides sp. YIM 152588]|uniref:YciI family protein n=1 Tax=Nocardioides sp. YIM 152588 TaxID=3158259 RepID=UPI0032E3EF6C